jgi:aminopeptidase N
MFGKVASFEFRYQLRQPVFWVATVAFFLLAFGAITSDVVHIGGDSSFVHKNSPFVIAQISIIWSLFFMFVTTAFVANVIVRDEETGFGPIIRTTQISKFDYLFGRFTGAFLAGALAFVIAGPLPIIIGSFMPWIDPETVGPFRVWPYVYTYLVFALPGLLISSAVFFALATVTRSMMATYLGVVALFVLWFVTRAWGRQLELEATVAITDPFGFGAYGLATKYWTATERNALTPALTGILLWNRVLVLAVSAACLGLAYSLFQFGARSGKAKRRDRARATEAAPVPEIALRAVEPRFGLAAALQQLWVRTKLDIGQVVLSPGFVVLLALGVINSAANIWFGGDIYGTDIHPVTRVMIQQLKGSFFIFAIIVAVYYAGDLVWRERDRRTNEIVESTPVPDWAFVAPKTLAISLVLIAMLLVSVATAMASQAIKGGASFEIGKYLWWYVAPNAVDCFFFAALAVVLQVITPHKFFGWGAMVLYIVASIVLPGIGWDHNLYLYGGASDVMLSDMNGQGSFWIGAWWFRLYWSAFALLLLILSYGLWRRGVETRLLPRLKRLPRRLGGAAGVLTASALLVFLGSGVFIFINTNVWNTYRSSQDEDRWLADFEKTLLKYETTPQPKIISERLDVDIRPTVPQVTTSGVYLLENKTGQPLREIHVRFPRDLILRSISIEGARPKTTFDRFNYRIFAFDTPMAPGEQRRMAFETVLTQRGFKNSGGLTSVVGNGTFLNDRAISPQIGMDRMSLLEDRRKRRKYGLPAELRMAKLGTPGADRFNILSHDADWVTADIRVTTDADQTPIAPGQTVSERVSGGRRTVEFRTDAPILRYFSIQSARYAVRRDRTSNIDLAVYYDPAHPWNVDRMLTAAKASLAYYQANFSPYQFRQLRYLEFPAFDGNFAESFANTVPWSEGIGFIANLPASSDKIDYVTYVGAHEIAHQWWGHQEMEADEQGGPMLSETLAQYSALMVMKHMYGPDMIRRFLRYELDTYLARRGGDVIPEQPLKTVENQQYIFYQKGSLAMYRLQDELGEDVVNRALRTFLAKFAFKGPPYPTSTDLISAFRAVAPPDKQALITDLFEKITLYDLKAAKASEKKRPDGRWDVALTVSARKMYADGSGHETTAPMNETLDVGLFTAEPGKPGFKAKDVVQMTRLPIRSGTQVLRLVAPGPVRFAGVDPYNKLIDRNADDNVTAVAR